MHRLWCSVKNLFLATIGLFAAATSSYSATGASIAVPTYHYNALRTGWNNQETQLSASTFPENFGLLVTVAVDEQVDAPPLLAPAQNIAGGTYDVLYVV